MADGQVKDQDQLTDEELRRQAAAELAARQAAANAVPEESRATKLQVGSTAQPMPTIPPTQDLSAPAPDVTGLKPIASPSLTTTEPARPGRPTAPAGSLEDTRNRLSQLQWERENPLGSAGNQPGALGKIKHTLGKIGNIAGDIFVPNVMADIPGTELHRQLEERSLGQKLERQEKEAGEQGLRNVQEQNLQSEIAARTNPKPKLLPGDENVATDAQGNRYQRYEMADQSTAWAPEGQVPALRPIAAPSTPTGGLTPIAAPNAPAPPAATAAPEATGGAPALAPGALPAGAVAGKPKAETDETHFIAKFLKDNNLPNTADNIAKARASYNSGGPIGDARAKELSTQISNVLKGTGIDTAGYTISEKSTSAEANEALKAARDEAAAVRQAKAPQIAEKEKEKREGNLYSATVNGREVAGTWQQMKTLGAKEDDLQKVSTENAAKIENARVLSQWINSKDPDDPGVIALAQKLDKEGKLGPLMSRYQDFINRSGSVLGFNSGDPDFQRLMTGMGLEQTALMQVHVGSRGGAALLDHFHDLADAKQLSGPAFLAALDYENKYIQRKAMTAAAGGGGGTTGHSFTINGVPYHNVSEEDYGRAKQIRGFKE